LSTTCRPTGRTSRSGRSACRTRSSRPRPRCGSTSTSRRRAFPEKPAYIFFGRELTYRELHAQADAIAGWLQSVGVGAGDRVAIYLQNCPQYVAAYYGILRANAVVVPVNPMNRAEEFKHYVTDPGTKVVICSADSAAIVDGANARLPRPSAWRRCW
jgi:fatty-acyl-CoA synthase